MVGGEAEAAPSEAAPSEAVPAPESLCFACAFGICESVPKLFLTLCFDLLLCQAFFGLADCGGVGSTAEACRGDNPGDQFGPDGGMMLRKDGPLCRLGGVKGGDEGFKLPLLCSLGVCICSCCFVFFFFCFFVFLTAVVGVWFCSKYGALDSGSTAS